MNKKGFTLIELLAVIVILAIIAVITVPKIADMISSSRQGGAEDSFYGTLKAAELGYTKALQSNTGLKGSTCTIEDSKITCTNGVKIDVSGKTSESGTLIIDSAGSTIAKGLTLNGYKCYGDLSTSNPCVKVDEQVASETLIKKATTSGDGLYKDSYEEGRYVFKGQTPNNYITFNNESWRIVAVEADGTLKIIKDEKLDNKQSFDSVTSTTAGRRLNSNNTYCRKWTDGNYYGCNAWSAVQGTYVNNAFSGTVTEDSLMKTYLNDTYYKALKADSKKQIQPHNFKTGAVLWGTTVGNTKAAEDKDIWNGNVSLLSLSDWYKASSDASCIGSLNDFYTDAKGVVQNNYKCSLNNYLYKSSYWWWLLSAYGNTTNHVLHVNNAGYIDAVKTYDNGGVRPVLHLKANIELTGTGTKSDPYKIE